VSEQLALLPAYLTGHVQLTLVALLLGTVISVPVGIVATRVRWLEQVVLGAAGIIQTVPSLALLAIMVPALAAIQVQSIGYLPAIIGLTLYSTLPILRNTVIGIAGVDPAYTEAAKGVGMTQSQQLWWVELPLAMPVIVGGLRTSTVWVVGMATLSTPVGATSLGNYIFSGLQTRNYTAVMVGSVVAALLAQLLDGLIRVLEEGVRFRRSGLVAAALGVLSALYLFAGVTLARQFVAEDESERIVIGSKPYTEQYILSEIISGQVTAETGLNATVLQSLGSTVAFDALRSGDLDVYVDYSGTIWATILRREANTENRGQILGEVERLLTKDYGVHVVGALGFENTYALAMRSVDVKELRLQRISDLVPHASRLVFGSDYEFFGRPEWVSLQARYGLSFDREVTMDPSLMYQAVAQQDVDVITAFSTDGRIVALGLTTLEDDRNVMPPYDAVILVSDRLVSDQPRVVAALGGLVGAIDLNLMRAMNLAVDEGGRTPRSVAEEFLAGRSSTDVHGR
jgi:osmoprotectant transport system permease protein|tara:strand:- start:58848 stop:60389 length:1542 start_codon:yes stop_codon:yes gene_type:complete